jgi:dihydrofolate reductase
MKITVINHISLDGVMQAPAAPDEDTRDGFPYGGWAAAGVDEVIGREMAKGWGQPGGMLFGRRTYERMSLSWRGRTDNPYTEVLDNAAKYVVSTTLSEPLDWQNSVLVRDLAHLKEYDGHLTVLGSQQLIQSLRAEHLIDQYVLLIHPLLLGQGRRLFPDGAPDKLRLVDSVVSTTGVIIATYEEVPS